MEDNKQQEQRDRYYRICRALGMDPADSLSVALDDTEEGTDALVSFCDNLYTCVRFPEWLWDSIYDGGKIKHIPRREFIDQVERSYRHLMRLLRAEGLARITPEE